MHVFIGEFFGTCVLIVLGQSVAAGANLKKTFGKATGTNWFYISFAWGIAVTMGVYVAGSLGSLGHLNPAITIAYALFGLFPWHNVVPYILGQMLGAFVGAVIVMIQFYPQFKNAKTVEDGNSVAIFATMPAIKNNVFNFLSEFIAALFFVLILLNLGNFTVGLKPFIVGMVIFIIGAGLGTTTGFAINPARDLAPRFAYTIMPVPNKDVAHWEYAWVPLFGPILGAITAAAVQAIV
jgi:glycerol uptake facilitator protein